MKVAVSSIGKDLDAQISSIFGRCVYLLFVDSESLEFEAQPNPAVGASGGAGIQAAQFIVDHGAEALLTGNVGPNAMQVLQAANVPVYPVWAGTVRQAVEAFGQGQIQQVTAATTNTNTGKAPTIEPTTPAGTSLGRGMGQGRRGGGGGMGGSRGAGGGQGRGGGAGTGGGRGGGFGGGRH